MDRRYMSFNSLFEIHILGVVEGLGPDYTSFNSLFEILFFNAAAIISAAAVLSILFLRFMMAVGAGGAAVAAATFQFSF